MANVNFNAEAGTVDTALTGANLALQGTTAQQVTPVTSGTGAMMIRNAASGVTGAPIHGTKSYDFNGAAGDLTYMKNTEAGTPTTKKQAITMYFAAAPSADMNVLIFQGSSGSCATVVHRSTGRIALLNANAGTSVWVSNATTGVLTYPCTVTFDMDLNVGTNGSGNTGDGVVHLNVYKHSVSTTTPWASTTDGSGTEVNNNYFRTGVIVEERAGKQTSAPAYRIIADSWRIGDGMGLQGTVENPVNSPPVVAIPTGQVISKLTGDTFSFTATASDPEGNTLTYLWANATRPAGAAAPTLTGSTTLTVTGNAQTVVGTYTVTFKANDGLVDSSLVTGTVYYAASDGSISAKSIRAGSSYTGTVANLNDASDTTVFISPDAPAGAFVIIDMNPVAPGDAFTLSGNALTLRMRKRAADGVSDTTATITVKVEVLTGPTDTLVNATVRNFVLTNTITPYAVLFTSGESAAFTDHNVWAIRITTTEG